MQPRDRDARHNGRRPLSLGNACNSVVVVVVVVTPIAQRQRHAETEQTALPRLDQAP